MVSLLRERSFFTIPLIIILVVLVSGCVNQSAGSSSSGGATGGTTTIGAISMSFFEGAPPQVIGEGDSFDVGLTVDNVGDYDLAPEEIEVFLRGVNPRSFGFGSEGQSPVSQLNNVELQAVQAIGEDLVGGKDALSWQNLCYDVDIDTDQTVNFIAQSCYKYLTTARFDACFNKNPYVQATGTETCSVVGEREVISSRAPIKITSVSESPAGSDKFRFIVKVANEGQGQVYDYDAKGTMCVDAKVQELNIVKIESIRVGSEIINPAEEENNRLSSFTWLGGTEDPHIRLVGGQGQFMFTYEPEFLVPVYTESIEVKLNYGYTGQASRSVSISAIPGLAPQCSPPSTS